MAYTTRMAAALSGATLSQLRHWRRPGPTGTVLVPEIMVTPRVLYSFRDLLALRTFVRIRQDVSLQMIRTALNTLRRFGEVDHLSAYRLVTDGKTIQLVTEQEAVDLVKRPGQRQVIVVMGAVIEPFPVRAGVVVPHLFQPNDHVSVDPETQGGHPVITGTRVPYELVAELLDDDVPPEKIPEFYPSVSPDAARDAREFALYVNSYDLSTRAA